ncbi:MAG: hypothetical protein KAV42_03215 [Candidatus Krumholzibacteria bacterium]|nr:hypothetical protein [Candidatus Krumholzibacteria bacterium]
MDLSENVKDELLIADKWQLRCKKCGKVSDAAELGANRISDLASSWTLGWCSSCRQRRIIIMEPKKAG